MNPISALYAAGVATRNALYESGRLTVRRLRWPVISVGNLSVGGSGKTPFVIALGALLKQNGYEVDVLSRGYRRSRSEVSAVDPNGTPAAFGDEPLLISRKLKASVFVGSCRYKAGLLAENRSSFCGKHLHLLDDAFQHRQLARDFDIVLINHDDFESPLLPVGRLREPFSSLQRADAVAIFEEDIGFDEQERKLRRRGWNGSIWKARRQTDLCAAPKKAVAFCGIGRPRRFFAELRSAGIEASAEVRFPDHHRYHEQDIAKLLEMRKSIPHGEGFVCTEKDEINLGLLAGQLQPLFVARMVIQLQHPVEVLTEVRAKVSPASA